MMVKESADRGWLLWGCRLEATGRWQEGEFVDLEVTCTDADGWQGRVPDRSVELRAAPHTSPPRGWAHSTKV